MQPTLIALLAFCLMLGGCQTTNKLNPFVTNSYCDSVFGYPPRAIARILDVDRPIKPSDFTHDDD